MKVLVLFCGGTIIMEEAANGSLIAPDKNSAVKTLMNLEPNISKIADIDLEYIDNIDSANMEPHHWEKMAQVIFDNYDDYDGFVITHGTNSMAYTSSALSFILEDLGKPVVLTGSQMPANIIETDARRNYINAVRVATQDIAGVFVVFDEEIILGARASKVSESKLNGFQTINWDLVGEIRIDIRFSIEVSHRNDDLELKLSKGFEENIAVLTLIPGTPVELVENILDSGVKALVLAGYGPGDISYKYLDVIKKATKMRVPVIVTTQCIEGSTLMGIYDVGQQALDAGAIQAYDMSIECITTKLMWALDKFDYEDIAQIMHKSFVGEINTEAWIY